MSTIFKNDNLELIKLENTNKYIIQFRVNTDENEALIRSLVRTRIIQGATVTRDYLTIKFQAHSVETFFSNNKIQKIKIPEAANILQTLANQLNYLLQYESKTILGYAPNQIILINGKTPAFLGSQLIAELDPEGGNMATICCLFNTKEFFAAPELLKINRLPAKIHYKSSYFSLASLIIYLLIYNPDNQDTFDNNPLSYLDKHPIKNTKLYWLLSRCLEEDPNKRSIIFI
jgi:hypothetical protein